MLSKARKELDKARGRLRLMSGAASLEAAENLWIECLHHLERAHNKVEAQLKEVSRFKGWPERGRVIQLRREDPLLSYLKNARDADEHTIAEIAERVPGGIGINSADGGPLEINSLILDRGRIHIDSPRPVSIRFEPARLALRPVTNRGRTYAPPDCHLDARVNDQSPAGVAAAGIAFYSAYFDKLEEHLST